MSNQTTSNNVFSWKPKTKVATSTWSMLEPHMWNGNHLQSNMSWDMPHRTFTCTGNPQKKNPSLLWDYEFANDGCAVLQPLCLILQQLGLGNALVDSLFDRCMCFFCISHALPNCQQKSSYCHWTDGILFIGQIKYIYIYQIYINTVYVYIIYDLKICSGKCFLEPKHGVRVCTRWLMLWMKWYSNHPSCAEASLNYADAHQTT